MSFESYKNLLEQRFTQATVAVTGSGNKIEIDITSPEFEQVSAVKRHQMVYKVFNEQLASGELHAISIKAHAPGEAGN